jgi:Transmembrane secretion effector
MVAACSGSPGGSVHRPVTLAPKRQEAEQPFTLRRYVSNVGTWMQTVGAQWLVVHGAHAAVLVWLVQTACTLLAVLFALVGGVLADIFERARLLVAVLADMVAAAKIPAMSCLWCRRIAALAAERPVRSHGHRRRHVAAPRRGSARNSR